MERKRQREGEQDTEIDGEEERLRKIEKEIRN